MNQNFRREKPKTRPTLDGVSARPVGRFRDVAGGRGVPASRTITPQRNIGLSGQGPVNDFDRSNGFHSTQQKVSSGRTETTFVIDRKSTKKKRRFGRKKSDLNKSSKKPASKKKKILRVTIIVFIILALLVGFLFAKGYLTLRKILQGGGGAAALTENVDPSLLSGEGDGRVNILLLGRGGEGHDGADLTDTIILASIDPIANEAALLSIPRDFYVPVGDYGSMKVNAAFATGKNAYLETHPQNADHLKEAENQGLILLEKTLQDSIGVPIHYHLMVDFKGFQQAVDNVGGVDFTAPDSVAEQMRIDGQDYYLNVSEGFQHMDGFEALAYARSRHTSPRGDFDRAERQRAIITALKDKIMSAGTFSNPQKISNLLSTFGNHVQTNFAIGDLQRLYQISQKIGADKITSLDLVTPPNVLIRGNMINGQSVQIPSGGIGDFAEIRSYVRNVLKDSFLKKEDAKVIVLNGTNKVGMATEKGDELKSYGYTVIKVDNAPTRNYEHTIIVDLTNGAKKYTKNYLEKRFKVTAVGAIPDPQILPESADFVIILGNDQSLGS